MKYLFSLALCARLSAAVYLDWNTSAMPSVTAPFRGVPDSLPALDTRGILKQPDNVYLATAIASNWVVTATHVSQIVGQRYVPVSGGTNSYRVTRRVDLKYPFLGTTIGADVTLLKIDPPIDRWFPIATNTPATGAECIGFGSGSVNVPSKLKLWSQQFDFQTRRWTLNTNTELVSSSYGARPAGFRWYRSQFMQFRDTYEAARPTAFFPPGQLDQQNALVGNIVIPPIRGAGYGIAGYGDSGSPVFVARTNAGWGQRWEFVFPMQQSSSMVFPASTVSKGIMLPGMLQQVQETIAK